MPDENFRRAVLEALHFLIRCNYPSRTDHTEVDEILRRLVHAANSSTEAAAEEASGPSSPRPETTTRPPWWHGTVCPTGNLRVKVTLAGNYRVQQLVRPTGGGRGRWLNVPMVDAGVSDDE